MPMKMLTPAASISAMLKAKTDRINRAAVRQLCYAGEQCTNIARSRHTYKRQTGNLTSSIGYIVAQNGRVIEVSDFPTVLNGQQGSKEGLAYAKSLVRQYTSGIVLIVVAGMEYAAYVSDRGYDVLDSAELEANRIVPILLSQLKLS